jgi:hypothetical protein
MVRRQVITIGEANEPVDLNYSSVMEVMRLYGVKDKKDCFEKVCRLFNASLEYRRRNR